MDTQQLWQPAIRWVVGGPELWVSQVHTVTKPLRRWHTLTTGAPLYPASTAGHRCGRQCGGWKRRQLRTVASCGGGAGDSELCLDNGMGKVATFSYIFYLPYFFRWWFLLTQYMLWTSWNYQSAFSFQRIDWIFDKSFVPPCRHNSFRNQSYLIIIPKPSPQPPSPKVTCAPCCLWPPRSRPSARRRRSSGRRCRRRVAVRSAGWASRAARCDGRTCWEGCGRAWWPRRGLEGLRREEKFGWPEARLDDLVWQIFGDFLHFFCLSQIVSCIRYGIVMPSQLADVGGELDAYIVWWILDE